MKKTDWYARDQKPARDGVYERDYSDASDGTDAGYCLFKFGHWYCFEMDINVAARATAIAFNQRLPWRGLAEKPVPKKPKTRI